MHEVFLYEHRQKRKLVCGLIWSGHIHVHSFLVDARMNTESVEFQHVILGAKEEANTHYS